MLKLGSEGNFAKAWQELLNAAGYPCGVADGVFGNKTKSSTAEFQIANHLVPDGVVGTGTFRCALHTGLWPSPEGYPLVQCTYYNEAKRGIGDIDWIVIHDMEVPEAQGMAIEIAGRFALSTSPKASAHFHVDNTVVIQGCSLGLVAWHANSGNRRGIGVEHAGFASQRPVDWDDEYSQAELKLSAKLSADLCKRFGLPTVWVDSSGLLRGERGITSHAAINDAFNGGGGHRDPGLYFPRQTYIEAVQTVLV